VAATQLFVPLLDVAHAPTLTNTCSPGCVGSYERSQSTSGMARSSSSVKS
jgi:hypothetical protein